MVVVSNKDLLSWYLITVKLNETIEAGRENTPRSIGSPRPPQQQQQQPPSELPQVGEINGEIEKHEFVQSPDGFSWESYWLISIKKNLDQARRDELPGSWSKLCIYRVPHILRKLADAKAYIPQVVSLGPYHEGSPDLQEMERHKWRALCCMLNRTRQDINIYLDSMKELEEKARACYEQLMHFPSEKFVEMMVLDGCFVLELFRGVKQGFPALGYAKNDPVFAKRVTMHSIKRDMMMLENQIPLFVLDKLLGLQLGNPDQKGLVYRLALKFFHPSTLTEPPIVSDRNPDQKGLVSRLARKFFHPLTPTEPSIVIDRNKLESSLRHVDFAFDPLSDQGALHCLDVFRISLLSKGPQPVPRIRFMRPTTYNPAPDMGPSDNPASDKGRQELIHCATDLKNAGIKFKMRRAKRFWDIKFKNGVLKIPPLLVDDGTKSLFFNLIAFEQCHIYCTHHVTSYAIFMDNLINSAEDVGYLHSRGIIEHWLGNDTEVADLFNNMCREVVFDRGDSYLSELSTKVNNYYENPWHHRQAILKSKYFNSPWAVISFIAAVLLLSLTALQSFYGVYGYYRPSS